MCDDAIYEPVLYDQESHFERIVRSQLAILLPDFYIVPFKIFVQGDEGLRRKPDLAIIHREFGTWAVVEVELAHHSLDRHVYPQMQCFSTGLYDQGHAEYLCRINQELSVENVLYMIKYVEPKLIVIVNSTDVLNRGWGRLSQELGVKLAFLETFRSNRDRAIFRFDGYLPTVNPMRVAGARKHRMINALRCQPIAFFEKRPNELTIYVEDRPVRWRQFATADTVLLTPKTPIELTSSRNYEITQSTDGRLNLVRL